MSLDYQKVWSSMNELETTICKAVSVREVIDAAMVAMEHRDYEKAENLMNAAYDFIGYFVDDFDNKFKDAWKETVVKLKRSEENNYSYLANDFLTQDRVSNFPGEEKVKRWVLPVQEIENGDTMENEYFITLPDDLLEVAEIKEEDQVEWIDNGDGSYLLKKCEKTHEQLVDEEYKTYKEAISDGWTMTADGFWIKE